MDRLARTKQAKAHLPQSHLRLHSSGSTRGHPRMSTVRKLGVQSNGAMFTPNVPDTTVYQRACMGSPDWTVAHVTR